MVLVVSIRSKAVFLVVIGMFRNPVSRLDLLHMCRSHLLLSRGRWAIGAVVNRRHVGRGEICFQLLGQFSVLHLPSDGTAKSRGKGELREI